MTDNTVAYQRPRPKQITWRIRVEAVITRLRDWHDTLNEVLPVIAAFVVLLWFINMFSRGH